MSRNGKAGLRLALLTAAGLLVNQVPVEVFPGIHFVFGSAFALLAGVLLGPLAGGAVGFLAALPTWFLWNQPLPLSAVLYGLEGAAVGYLTRDRRYGVVTADLAYWLLAGSWLNLVVQLTVIDLPFRVAFIIQCRSILNGLLVAMVVELGLILYGLTRRRGATPESERLRPSFHSVVTLALTALLALPILGITLRNSRTQGTQRLDDLEASAEREVDAIRGEVGALVQSYGRGLGTAAEIIREHGYMSTGFLQDLLAIVHREYPEFAGLYVADARARTLAFEPPQNEEGESLIGLDFSDRAYYRELLAQREVVYSGVYQARGGMTEPVVAIGAPILTEDGELEAFVLGWFDIGRSFRDLVERFELEGSSVVITDREGKLIADSRMMGETYTTVRDRAHDPDFVHQGGGSSGVFLMSSSGGPEESPAVAIARADHLVAFTTEPMTGWRIWSHRSLAPIRQAMVDSTALHLLVLMASLLAALALSSALARLLAAPLERLRRSAERLAAGELSERPVEPALATAEMESLFHSFSAMASHLDRAWDRQGQLLREVTLTKRDLEATFEAMTDGVVITDPEDRILRANRAFRVMGNLPPGLALEGMRLRELSHPGGDWESCPSCAARLSGESTMTLLSPEENRTGRPIEVRVDHIRDASGRPEGAVQVIRDLTELRRWEAEAERAESLLRNFVEAAFDPVFVLDLDGRLQWANGRTLEVFGLGRRSVRGRLYLDLIDELDRPAAAAVLRQATAGAACRRELRLAIGGGSGRHVLLTLSPVFVVEEVVSVLGIARDVTEEKLSAERARRDDKLRALGQLAAGVAHNFNNALTSVLGYTQLARETTADPRVRKPLEIVEVAARDAAAMVRRIQQFARAEKEEPLRIGSIDTIVQDALQLTRSRWETDAQAAGIHYEVCVEGGVEPADGTITCDPSALREVFVNLIINALDAMPEGGTLGVETSAGDGTVEVSVTDTGCGMTEEVRERLFEPFFTTKGPTGQGMGLAVSYGTVRRHRGQIQVASEPDRGSRLTVVLPLRVPVAAAPVAGHPAGADSRGHSGRDTSILLVEDEEPIRNLVAKLLTQAGFLVTAAADGREALWHLATEPFDLVLTDLAMPRADGMAVAREVRQRCPNARLVIMTGYGDARREACERWSEDVPVDSWLGKPFDAATLIATLETVLQGGGRSGEDRSLPPGAPAASTG